MAKNRRNISAAVRFGPAIKALLVCSILVGAGVGYVWQKKQIHDLGQQIGERQTRLRKLQDQNGKLKIQVATLSSQTALMLRIQQMKLVGLGPPQQSQIVRLPEPPLAAEAAPANAEPMPVDSARWYTGQGMNPTR